MDFSTWRHAVVGAERLFVSQLAPFARLTIPLGFRDKTFRAAYGLAEATLAVSGQPAATTPKMLRIENRWLSIGQVVARPYESAASLASRDSGDPSLLMSSGRPLDGVHVEVRAEDGVRLPENVVGEIVVQSRSVLTEIDDGGPTPPIRRTGDAGFISGGDLYVLGRIADVVKVRGRLVSLVELDEVIATTLRLKPQRCGGAA
jgi:acyl-CoA synthetase (AMP-forming)/AMP-acid ligase II